MESFVKIYLVDENLHKRLATLQCGHQMSELFHNQSGKNRKIAIAVARFHSEITESLRDGAIHTLTQFGVTENNIYVAEVPGAFELPLICQELAKRYDAVIALGCVIQGDTPHFDYVCAEVSRGLMDVSLKYEKPILMGVLTCNDYTQAKRRSSSNYISTEDKSVEQEKQTPESNKGSECALAALETLASIEKIS